MAKIHEAIAYAIAHDEAAISRFWSMVQRDESADDCWLWVGPVRPGNHATLYVGQRNVPAARIACFTATGEFPLAGRLFRVCGNDLCVRPTHLAWALGRQAERMIMSQGDGYVGASGVRVDATDRTGRQARVLRFVSPDASERRRLAG